MANPLQRVLRRIPCMVAKGSERVAALQGATPLTRVSLPDRVRV